jgi:hypothetical protein
MLAWLQMLLLIGVFTGCALITLATARPLVERRVAPNRIYGLKMKATFADEWVWYEANAASGRDFLKWGYAQLAAVLLPLAFLRPASWTAMDLDRAGVVYLAINLAVMLTGLLVASVVGWVRANRLLAERVATGAALKPKPPGL